MKLKHSGTVINNGIFQVFRNVKVNSAVFNVYFADLLIPLCLCFQRVEFTKPNISEDSLLRTFWTTRIFLGSS